LRAEFWPAPLDALFDRSTVAAALNRSNAWLEMKATAGGGPPFLKFGRRVLYRKRDVLAWLDKNSISASSTSSYSSPDTLRKRKRAIRSEIEADV
jgi:hypothetical protein